MANTSTIQTEKKFCYTPAQLAFSFGIVAAGAVVGIGISDGDVKNMWFNALLAFIIFFIVLFIIYNYYLKKDQ